MDVCVEYNPGGIAPNADDAGGAYLIRYGQEDRTRYNDIMIQAALGPVTFGVSDIIDILATSVLIYYLLLLIRGTRAVQILVGLLVVLFILALANTFHLLVLATIMQYLLLGTAVTIPIVFQPELRRALEQIGRGRLFGRHSLEEGDVPAGRTDAMAILTEAAISLSRNRTGGLIAIEQQTGLKEYVESGTTLDAALSTELLLTLFTHGTPLHDGAVIVKGAMIEAAGCFLPLSENVGTDRHLGSRHRAALGLSEQTDAVVIVVSETGSISVAREGRLSREIDDGERLRKVLLACTRPPRIRRRHREGVFSNWRALRPRVASRTKELRT
jgi:diadenylate cyclase